MTIGLVKISILLFYLRVFPVKSLRWASWAMIGYCVASTTAFGLATVFQCGPIEYVWNKDLKGGHCINYNALAWANAAVNIQQDLLIMLLPLNALRNLQLCLKKKIGMYAMFGVGSLYVFVHAFMRLPYFVALLTHSPSVCITSMVRLESLRSFGLTADPTWDNIPTTFWSTLETTTAIFCACMPAIRAGLVRLFPKVMSTIPRTFTEKTFRSTFHGGANGTIGSAYVISKNWTSNSTQGSRGSVYAGAVGNFSTSATGGAQNDKDRNNKDDKSGLEMTDIVSRSSLTTVDEEGGQNSDSEMFVTTHQQLSPHSTTMSLRVTRSVSISVTQTPQPRLVSIYNPARRNSSPSKSALMRNSSLRSTVNGQIVDLTKPLPPLPEKVRIKMSGGNGSGER